MEKKTTQRIIGILIAISLVIILTPLLFTKTESSDTASVSPSPLPDQSKLATNNPTDSTKPAVANPTVTNTATPDQTTTASNTTVSTDQTSAATVTSVNPTPTPTPTIATTTSATTTTTPVATATSTETQATTVASTSQPTSSTQTNTDTQNSVAASKTTDKQTDTTASATKSAPEDTHYSVISSPTTDEKTTETVTKITTADVTTTDGNAAQATGKHTKSTKHHAALKTQKTWAIQLGSFKDKSNAIRLTDKLKAAGYKAFTRQMTSAKGTLQTRVYIGPVKQASAEKLTNKLEETLKIKGILVSYKPLEG